MLHRTAVHRAAAYKQSLVGSHKSRARVPGSADGRRKEGSSRPITQEPVGQGNMSHEHMHICTARYSYGNVTNMTVSVRPQEK